MNRSSANIRSHRALVFLLFAFVALAVTYSIVTPIFEAGDEVWHYPFVQHLATGHGLPVQDPNIKTLWEQEGGQPPLYYVLSALAAIGAVAGLLIFLMFLVLFMRGDASAGDLVAYITLAGLLPKPIRQLSEVSSTIQKGVSGAESIFEQLDETPEIDSGTLERERVAGRLEINGLSFVYPGTDKQVLHNISFTAEPGQMVALVGRSGSGKSTLANLIPRFYHHDRGQILLDGAEIEAYRLRNLRQHIALVTQQVTLFNDTVANNIAYGDLAGAPIEDIRRAAQAAYADEFIEQMPQGYQTQVGENGVLLSGGQRQRLAIARALLKDAPVLILDEATSALDTESERHIQGALDHVMTGRTTLVIAHRLSTIEKADLILVMEQGRIVERGRHAELLAANGAYAKLHETQFKDEP